jgi:hypothetical protein
VFDVALMESFGRTQGIGLVNPPDPSRRDPPHDISHESLAATARVRIMLAHRAISSFIVPLTRWD